MDPATQFLWIWVGVVVGSFLSILFRLGLRGESAEAWLMDTNPVTVVAIVFWPIAAVCFVIALPFFLAYRAGRWVRRKKNFWPNVLRRLAGKEVVR